MQGDMQGTFTEENGLVSLHIFAYNRNSASECTYPTPFEQKLYNMQFACWQKYNCAAEEGFELCFRQKLLSKSSTAKNFWYVVLIYSFEKAPSVTFGAL